MALMTTTSNRQRAVKVMFLSALLTLLVAVVIYAGIIPLGDARARNLIALSVAIIAVVDAAVGVFHLTRS